MSLITKANILLALVLILGVALGHAYETQRETHLYTQVEQTVDLPGFGEYQDLLASYAFNTCQVKLPNESGKYSCENLVKTRNSENGGRRRDATNTSNSNGTHDGGLCQLNSAYHMPFIESERFNNPLSQLDYCLQVRVDAKNKGSMPRYAYHVRNKRDKGITFTQSNAGIVKVKETKAISYPDPDCLYMGTVGEGRRIQIDLHDKKGFVRILYEFIFGADEKGVAFNCKA